ncbi:hypothetical protein CEUSTIGMA_g5418.t1 [Chlamydomonas eustigma]|uniref:MaoC-like domain-containing protein n=1 Tax=Chlamydomonas eustigma TaxID=1157962 RepID=A0A250X4J6_9CHLO|nr:hypothetical protein CEUSTIGMA_g5418.t1 [Chlamydomonas eustigma]|eukprot:GAX77976.1 hypothetical protein CEUSTIGMA_g5418.t1 [Chlamydomonas eustigma]
MANMYEKAPTLFEHFAPMYLYVTFTMLLLATMTWVYMNVPTESQLSLTAWPKLPWIYIQIMFSALIKGKELGTVKKQKADEQEIIEVRVLMPKAFDLKTLSKFKLITGNSSPLTSEVPLLYPIVESFRLCMQVMALPRFPLNVLGSVLARNRAEFFQPIHPTDRLVYSCRMDSVLRTTAKGDTEVDLISTALNAEGELVWKNTLTVIVLGKNRFKAGSKAAGSKVENGHIASSTEAECAWLNIGTIELNEGSGRQYGFLNGDVNPIHMHSFLSRLFGYKRPIAHALYLVARAESAIMAKGVKLQYPCALATDFKRPTLLPAKLQVEMAQKAQILHFRLLTSESLTKVVLTGNIMRT